MRENVARGATLIKYLTVRGPFSPSESLLLKWMEIQDLRVLYIKQERQCFIGISKHREEMKVICPIAANEW